MNDETIVAEIERDLIQKFKLHFGYCGVAKNDGFIMINSGNGNIIVKITWDKAPADAPKETEVKQAGE